MLNFRNDERKKRKNVVDTVVKQAIGRQENCRNSYDDDYTYSSARRHNIRNLRKYDYSQSESRYDDSYGRRYDQFRSYDILDGSVSARSRLSTNTSVVVSTKHTETLSQLSEESNCSATCENSPREDGKTKQSKK